VSRLLQASDDPALAGLFFSAFFRYLKEKADAVPEAVALLQKFEWRDVGQALLGALKGNNETYTLEVALEIASELPREAQQAMLAFTAKLSDKALSSTKKLEKLWAIVLRNGDDAALQALSTKFMEMSPRLLQQAAKTLVQHLKDASVAEDRKAGLVSIVACRKDWLKSQIRVLEKPFSWEMPVAEFPDNGSVQAFLLGPEEKTTTEGMVNFQGLSDASAYSFTYTARWRTVQVGSSFELKAERR
jgi:hypothetical protein